MIFHQFIFLFLNKYIRITSVYQIVAACVLHIKIEQNKNIVYIIPQTVSFTPYVVIHAMSYVHTCIVTKARHSVNI